MLSNRRAASLAGSTMALLLVGIALSACSGTQSFSSSVLPQRPQSIAPLAGSPAASPVPFAFQTVDDPSSNVNEVTAIDQSSDIVGTIGAGSASSPYAGYSSTSPYSTFQSILYTGALGIAVTGFSTSSTRTVVVGYVIAPPQLRGTWAFAMINGLITLLKDRKEGKGNDAVTEVLGVNDGESAVGYYTSSTGVNMPFVLDIPAEKFTALKPPGANGAEATGINDAGDITGWESTSSGVTGFLERAGSYYSLAYPGATATQALGINSQDQIVGYYQDSNHTKHGFVLTNPTQSQPVWQTVDEPNAAYGTVITGINKYDDICGYYVDADGVQHGFVATPSSS